MQLFDNEYVSRTDGAKSNDDKIAGSKDMSPKAHAVRSALLSLLPPRRDIAALVEASSMWWSIWESSFPEVCHNCQYTLVTDLNDHNPPMAPAEVAKLLIFLSIIVAQLPFDFEFGNLEVPFDPQEFAGRCVSEADRLIVHDDYFATTLPGIECQMILSKYLLNEGRPRKAWLVNRRAIECAQLSGMHLSTAKPPPPGDTLFGRRLRLWCQLACIDRHISLILGLPYAVSDASCAPQVEMCRRMHGSTLDMYLLQLGIMSGKVVDRNQNFDEPSLPMTMRLEQELEDMQKKTPAVWWDSDAGHHIDDEKDYERIMVQFTHHTLRLLLHLPFMLKSSTHRKFQYCHSAAVESAQSGLQLYRILRTPAQPYLCKVTDYFAFMMTMLLVIHLVGHSGESTNNSKQQDYRDWELIHETADLLRQSGTKRGGTVAAESANVLAKVTSCHANDDLSVQIWNQACKITVPYFGTITVGPGKKLFGKPNTTCIHPKGREHSESSKGQSRQLFTPPLSNLGDPTSRSNNTPNTGLIESHGSYPVDAWSQMGIPAIMPTVDLEINAFQGFLDANEFMWPNLDVDLALDQGWNVDWLGGSNLS